MEWKLPSNNPLSPHLYDSYYKLLRLPGRRLWCASAFLSFPFTCGRLLFVLLYCIVLACLSHLLGGHDASYDLIFIYIYMYSLSPSFFLSANASRSLAFVCRTCRIQHDGRSLHLSTLLTALQCSILGLGFCDLRGCIPLGGRIGTDTGCAGCPRVERTVYVKDTHTVPTKKRWKKEKIHQKWKRKHSGNTTRALIIWRSASYLLTTRCLTWLNRKNTCTYNLRKTLIYWPDKTKRVAPQRETTRARPRPLLESSGEASKVRNIQQSAHRKVEFIST